MKKLCSLLALLFLFTLPAMAQNSVSVGTSNPTGPCGGTANTLFVNETTGHLFSCQGRTWIDITFIASAPGTIGATTPSAATFTSITIPSDGTHSQATSLLCQGIAPVIVPNALQIVAPLNAGCTGQNVIFPNAAPASGAIAGSMNANTITLAYTGDANHSAVVTIGSATSIGSTSLCSSANCPAGTYVIHVYVDLTTACGTSGTYVVNLIYTDDVGSKTIPVNINGTGAVPATGVLTTTSTNNFGEASQVIRSTGSVSINYSTTAVACGTAGPMVGKLYLSAEPIQ